jgi:hypothetical protein
LLSTESDSADTKRASDEPLLSELKLEFEYLLRLKEGLENRANNLVAVSAAIATLLFGFTTFSYTRIKPEYQYFYWMLLPVSASIGASIIAMGFGLLSSRLARYALPVSYEVFFKANGSRNIDNINAYRDSTEIMFFNSMIRFYLDSIRANTLQYLDKAKWMRWAHILFLLSISVVPILLGFFVHALSIGMGKPDLGIPT